MFASATYKRRFGSSLLMVPLHFEGANNPAAAMPHSCWDREPLSRGEVGACAPRADPRQLSLPHVRRQSGEGSGVTLREIYRAGRRRTDRAGQSPGAVRDLQHRQGDGKAVVSSPHQDDPRHPTAALKPPSAYRPMGCPAVPPLLRIDNEAVRSNGSPRHPLQSRFDGHDSGQDNSAPQAGVRSPEATDYSTLQPGSTRSYPLRLPRPGPLLLAW